jgi:hypothetical protein
MLSPACASTRQTLNGLVATMFASSIINVSHPPHNGASENLQGGGVVSVTVRLHDNLHILVERHQEAQQAFHRNLPELTAQFGVRQPDVSKMLSTFAP